MVSGLVFLDALFAAIFALEFHFGALFEQMQAHMSFSRWASCAPHRTLDSLRLVSLLVSLSVLIFVHLTTLGLLAFELGFV